MDELFRIDILSTSEAHADMESTVLLLRARSQRVELGQGPLSCPGPRWEKNIRSEPSHGSPGPIPTGDAPRGPRRSPLACRCVFGPGKIL